MKKIMPIFIFLTLIFITGCSLGNTPTSKVDELMGKYQRLDTEIKDEIKEVVASNNIDESYQDRYIKALEKQYCNLTYEIKNEAIDGNTAIVTTQIEVTDYKKALNTIDRDDLTDEEYYEESLTAIEEANEKVTYTIDFTLTKDDASNWQLDELSEVDKKKIQGTY
mgnify:FL=1